LLQRVHRLANHLAARGLAPGDRAGVLLERGAASIIALLAVMRAGATWVPLESGDPDRRLALVVEDARLAAIVTDVRNETRLAALARGVPLKISLDREHGAIEAAPLAPPASAIDADSDAYVIYTSGTTGRPKGVAVTHRAIGAHSLAAIERYSLGPRDVVLQFASHGVDAALEQILPALAAGACLVMRDGPPWSPAQFARLLKQQSVTIADLPPAYLREVLQAWQDDPAQAPASEHAPRLLIVGGEVLAPATVRLWRGSALAGARLLNAYGPTEAAVTCAVHELSPDSVPEEGPIPIGRPLAGGSIHILDRDGNPVPEGVPGELHIGGRRLARGYLGQPALTRERFVANDPGADGSPRYRSGDIGWFMPGTNGLIALRGRIDHQVKIRGFRVEPAEIEAALLECGARAALVAASRVADGATTLTAFVAAPGTLDEAALRHELATRLPAWMMPERFRVLDALPLTAGGKVDRAALAALDSPPPQAPAATAPAGPTERRLLALWRGVLERPTLGVEDDFFRSGGHSLLALRLLAAVRREFGRELSMPELVQAPTVARQAMLLTRTGRQTAASSLLVPLATTGGAGAPLFLVHPVGGHVACYLELAQKARLGRPILGLQADGVARDTVEEIGAAYVAALREQQPAGPYCLAGWSLGGVIAYEIAQQLRRRGEAIAFLGLIDSYAPALLDRFEAQDAERPGDEAWLLRAFAQDAAGATTTVESRASSPRLFETFRNNLLALRAYRPQPYAGTLTLLATAQGRQVEPTLGWGTLAAGALVLHALPGNHYSLLKAPQLEHLIAVLEGALAPRAQPEAPAPAPSRS